MKHITLACTLIALHLGWGVQWSDTVIKPKCLTVNAGSIPATSTIPPTPKPARVSRTVARSLTVVEAHKAGWGGVQTQCLLTLWNRESRFNQLAHNKHSDAGGIPQILHLDQRTTTAREQILRGISYIKHRYGTPCAALQHHNRLNWY